MSDIDTSINLKNSTPSLFVEMEGISHTVNMPIPLVDFNFQTYTNEIHCLLGDFDSGKDVIIKMLHSEITPEEGTIAIDGNEVVLTGIDISLQYGIDVIPEKPLLLSQISALDNVLLFAHTVLQKRIKKQVELPKIHALALDIGIKFDLNTMVKNLTAWEALQVQILKALYRNARLLLFENLLAGISIADYHSLLSLVQKLVKTHTIGILFTTDDIDTAIDFSDKISILRLGKIVASYARSEFNYNVLARMIIGRVATPIQQIRAHEIGHTIALKVSNAVITEKSRKNVVIRGVNFEIKTGEAFAIMGGSSIEQKTIIDGLIGKRPLHSGTIILNGNEIQKLSVRQRRIRSVAYIPSVVHDEGIVPEFDVAHNLILGKHFRRPYVVGGQFFNISTILLRAQEIIEKHNMTDIAPTLPANSLNHDTLQKLVVLRELEENTSLIIAHNPTYTIGYNTREFIFRRLINARNNGIPILLVTSDIDEALRIADRIAVFNAGTIEQQIELRHNTKITKEDIMLMITSKNL